jgi:monoamine oxidase
VADSRTSPPLLVAWAGGPDAERLSGVADDELARRAVETLSELLGAPPGRLAASLRSAHVHDWLQDPFSRGAYSYLAVGGDEAPAALAAPLVDTLFFAGEATDLAGDTGTVHGAIATGKRAAGEVLASVRAS